jgi:head-tail adaptor
MIEKKTVIQDEFGQEIETWSNWHLAWMGKRDVQGAERIRTSQTLAEETVIWDSEWVEGLNAWEYRLNYNGRVYNITGLAEVGRKAGWEITSVAVRV